MFIAPSTALIFFLMLFAMGGGIALATAIFVLRARLCASLVVWAMLLGGWAALRASFVNGHRADFSPTGEDLRLRNWLVWLPLPIGIGAARMAGVAVGLGFRKRKTPRGTCGVSRG